MPRRAVHHVAGAYPVEKGVLAPIECAGDDIHPAAVRVPLPGHELLVAIIVGAKSPGVGTGVVPGVAAIVAVVDLGP